MLSEDCWKPLNHFRQSATTPLLNAIERKLARWQVTDANDSYTAD